MKKLRLVDWLEKNKPEDKKTIGAKIFRNQVDFVGKEIHNLFWPRVRTSSDEIYVVGSHSLNLTQFPVYYLAPWTGAQAEIWFRGNTGTWLVSVDCEWSARPPEFHDLFSSDTTIHAFFCPEFAEWVFGSYKKNPNKFTAVLGGNDYDLYTFLWLVKHNLKIHLPFT